MKIKTIRPLNHFLTACETGDIATVKSCMAEYTPDALKDMTVAIRGQSNSLMTFDISLFSWVCAIGQLDTLNVFIQSGVFHYSFKDFEYYGMVQAARYGHLDVVNRLLEIQSVRYKVGFHDNYAFREAAAGGALKVMQRLVEFQAVKDNITAETFCGCDHPHDNSALLNAIIGKHIAVVRWLLQFEDVLKTITSRQNNAIYYALRMRCDDIIDLLYTVDTVWQYDLRSQMKNTERYKLARARANQIAQSAGQQAASESLDKSAPQAIHGSIKLAAFKDRYNDGKMHQVFVEAYEKQTKAFLQDPEPVPEPNTELTFQWPSSGRVFTTMGEQEKGVPHQESSLSTDFDRMRL